MTKYITEYDGVQFMDKDGRDKVKQLENNIPTVVNTLTSTSTTSALSAAQGKVLNTKIPRKTSVENGKLYLLQEDGTKIDSGTTLPVSSSSGTGSSVDLSGYAKTTDIPTKVSQLTNDSNFVTENGLTAKGYAKSTDIPSVPTKTSQLTNDSNFVTETVLNNKGYAKSSAIPTKTSQLTNDSNFVTETVLNNKGYLTAADISGSGSGECSYTTSEKNKVSKLVAEKISIASFGAVGDGSTDNSSAIQQAIDSVTTGDRATIYIPDGIYCINTPIKLKKEITIRGNGIGSVIKEGSSFSGTALLYTEDASTAHTNVIVRDLELRGLKSKEITAIRYNCVYWGTIQNCRIIDLGGNGIELVGGSTVTETCYVTNNLIIYCLKNGVYTNANTRDIHISGGDIGCHGKCGIELNALSSTVTGVQAVWGNGSNGIYEVGENNQIRCSNIEGNVEFGVYTAGKKLMITGCKFTANKVNDASPNGQVGIDNTASKAFISDCVFLNNVDPDKPVFNYSIANYGTGTVIGSNFYESTEKVLSSQAYTIASSQQVTV